MCVHPTTRPFPCGAARRPFLMQSRMSYTKIGIFSLAAYPYRRVRSLTRSLARVCTLAVGIAQRQRCSSGGPCSCMLLLRLHFCC